MVGLREQAVLDLQTIIGDTDGFAWSVSLKNPDGVCDTLSGLTTDIATTIDPETGQAVSGRTASVTFSMKTLKDLDCYQDFGMPAGVPDKTKKPWVVTFLDPLGNEYTFKVLESLPDRALECIVCLLEVYKDP